MIIDYEELEKSTLEELENLAKMIIRIMIRKIYSVKVVPDQFSGANLDA